jgi:hypothetical protein
MNTELMAQVRDLIEKHPEQHTQGSWLNSPGDDWACRRAVLAGQARQSCRTTACVAGWAVLLTAPADAVIKDDAREPCAAVILPDGQHIMVSQYAREALGISQCQSSWLFAGHRSRSEVLAALAFLPDNPDAGLEKLAANCGDG